MSSNLKVNTILPSTGTTIGIGTVGGLINVVGNIDVNSTSGISTFNGLEISGIVTAKAGAAVTYYGDGSNLTGITDNVVTINNNANNRVITGSGSANTLEGEANLTFDGNTLSVTGTGNDPFITNSTNSNGNMVQIKLSGTTKMFLGSAGSFVNGNSGTSNQAIRSEDSLLFATGGHTERFRITSAGVFQSTGTTLMRQHSVGIGTTNTTGRNAGVGTIAGEMIYNTTTSSVQFYNGASWGDVYSPPMDASGGSTSTSGGYKYHTFTSSGTFTANSSGSVDAIIIAGGGGGDGGSSYGYHGGGGGAGGAIVLSSYSVSAQGYSITVGAGGYTNANGSNSSAFGNTATGGGTGGSEHGNGRPGVAGGSGGGASYSGSGGSGTSGQGNPGGVGSSGGNWACGGGGGKGGSGGNAPNNSNGGNGGSGYQWVNGTTYAGGGGGCTSGGGNPGSGGSGGGGNGVINGTNPGSANTGGGGGGSDRPPRGGSGGSGVVIVRYAV